MKRVMWVLVHIGGRTLNIYLPPILICSNIRDWTNQKTLVCVPTEDGWERVKSMLTPKMQKSSSL